MEWISRQCDMQDQRRLGQAEGKTEGKLEGKLETAINLLKLNKLSFEDISQVAEISLETVKELAEQVKKGLI